MPKENEKDGLGYLARKRKVNVSVYIDEDIKDDLNRICFNYNKENPKVKINKNDISNELYKDFISKNQKYLNK